MKAPLCMNRTGIEKSPKQYEAFLDGLEEFDSLITGDEETPLTYRAPYIRESDPVGTVPPPGTVKGLAKAGTQNLAGRNAEVLIDKLGGRLAFERTGTRLYEAFINKCLIRESESAQLPLDRLQRFREEETAHMELLWEALRQLGADPTCVTPMADINGVASVGLMQIVSDPRTSVVQCLHAIHVAELVDNDGWQLLIKLSIEVGQNDIAEQFKQAMAEEDQHLALVRQLMEQVSGTEAGTS